jgi:hypothetical protein
MSAFTLEPTVFDVLVEKGAAAGYPTVRFDRFPPDAAAGGGGPAVEPVGPDEESGLWRLLRTPPNVAFVGSHRIQIRWAPNETKPDDIAIRAVLKRHPPGS